MSLPLPDVGPVDPRCRDLDEHLTMTGGRVREFGEDEGIATPGLGTVMACIIERYAQPLQLSWKPCHS